MRCIIIENSLQEISELESFIERIPFLDLEKSFTHIFEALEYLGKHHTDLIITNVKIDQLLAMDLLSSLPYKPLLIFTSESDALASDAFQAQAVDYLLKPVGQGRFYKAIHRCKELHEIRTRNKQTPDNNESQTKNNQDYILIKVEYDTIKIFLDDILYLEGLKDYVRIITRTNKYLTLNSLKNMEVKLPSNQFIRIHRSFIISLNNMEAIERNQIIIGDKRIKLGDIYKKDFNLRIGSNMT